MPKTNVRKHPRKTKTGRTTVIRHNRNVRDKVDETAIMERDYRNLDGNERTARELSEALKRNSHGKHDLTRDEERQIEMSLEDNDDVSEQLSAVSDLLNEFGVSNFGVEVIEAGDYDDSYYGRIKAEYINFGDTYDTTLIYDVGEREYMVTSWGSWYENHDDFDEWMRAEDPDYDDN